MIWMTFSDSNANSVKFSLVTMILNGPCYHGEVCFVDTKMFLFFMVAPDLPFWLWNQHRHHYLCIPTGPSSANTCFPGIIAIPSVPIVQNNAFPTSRLKMTIPNSHFFPGMESVFREKALIPEFLSPPLWCIQFEFGSLNFEIFTLWWILTGSDWTNAECINNCKYCRPKNDVNSSSHSFFFSIKIFLSLKIF